MHHLDHHELCESYVKNTTPCQCVGCFFVTNVNTQKVLAGFAAGEDKGYEYFKEFNILTKM